MKPSLKALLTTLAVALLAVAVLVPIAGASGSAGMMGSPSPWPTMMGTPTPSPSPTGNTWGDSWCGGGMWGGSGSWGGTGMWGTGTGASLADEQPRRPAGLAAAPRRPPRRACRPGTTPTRPTSRRPAAQQALHDLWTTFWNDMKAFYEQYGNGATWTCPSAGMWGGWHGRHDGRLLGSEPHVGQRLRRLVDDRPPQRLRPVDDDAREADRRRHRLAAALRRQPDRQRGADGACRPCTPTSARRSSTSTATTT